MNSLKIGYLGSGNETNRWLEDIAVELRKQDVPVTIVQSDSESIVASEEKFVTFLKELNDCSFIFVTLGGSSKYFKKYSRFIEQVKKINAEVFISSSIPEEMADNRDLFSFPNEDYNHIYACLELGGRDNLKSVIIWACNKIGGFDLEIPLLSYPATEGFYHPDMPGVIDRDSHLKRINPDKPVIGISIYPGEFHSSNLRAIDALIREIEERGLSAVTVFFRSVPDNGAMGVRRVIEEYLTKDGKPVIDVLINNQGISHISLIRMMEQKKNFPTTFLMTLIYPFFR